MVETANHTLYVRNLDSKLKFHTLRHNLYVLFSSYGNVIKIYLKPGFGHIVFASIEQASLAKKCLNDEMFFLKKLVIEYANQNSNLVEQVETP